MLKLSMKSYARSKRAAEDPPTARQGDWAEPAVRILATSGSQHFVADARRALQTLLRDKRDAIATSWTARHLSFEEIRAAVSREAQTVGEATFYRDSYVSRLLGLLRGAIDGKNDAWRAVYLDERTRFAVPAEIRLQANGAVLERVVEGDIDDLVERLPTRFRPDASTLLAALHEPLKPSGERAAVRMVLVGDCVMTELRAFLTGCCRELGTDVQIRHQYMSFDRGVGLNMPDVMKSINAGAVDLVALSFFTFEGLPVYRALLAECARLSEPKREEIVTTLIRVARQSIALVRESSEVPILLHNACGLPLSSLRRRVPLLDPIARVQRDVLDRLNAGLRDIVDGMTNVVLVDEVTAVSQTGLHRAARNLFPRKLRKGALFHTSEFGRILADAYAPIVSAYARLGRTKVLCVDFDNTLWAGVMAEGDVKQYEDVQCTLRKLREAGILLVALSKNDPGSIRWNEMILQPDDFVLHKINWNQKAQSVDEAAQLLSLGLDSFAVIDDNPVERALVADRFPHVTVLDPTGPGTWAAIELMLSFPNTRQTEESAARTALYREAAQRREAMVAQLDHPAMMATLGLKASWALARPKDLNRVHELLERTNQFNTTTKRRTLSDLRDLVVSPNYRMFVFSLSDRFGDLGLVGVVVVECDERGLVFDSVVMSCRAMGFGLESLLIRTPLDHFLARSGRRVPTRGIFMSTDRNEPASSIFANAGFHANEPGQWLLDPDTALPDIPPWLRVLQLSA